MTDTVLSTGDKSENGTKLSNAFLRSSSMVRRIQGPSRLSGGDKFMEKSKAG